MGGSVAASRPGSVAIGDAGSGTASSCARLGDVVGTFAVGEEPIVADAMEAGWAGRASGSGG